MELQTIDDQLIYYTENWQTPEGARQHIWGQEPKDIETDELFP